MFIDIKASGGDAQRFRLGDGLTVVGSDLQCDVIVAGTPGRWFEVERTPAGLVRVYVHGTEIGSKQEVKGRFGRFDIVSGPVTARVTGGSGTKQSRLYSVVAIRDWLPRPARVRRYSVLVPVACCAAVLAAAVARPGQSPTSKTSIASQPTRSLRMDTLASSQPADPVRELRDSIARMGFGDRVSVSRTDAGIAVDGELASADASNVRRIMEATRPTGLVIADNLRAPRQSPRLRIRAAGTAPELLVLDDGRRVEPGETIVDGWVLRRVNPHDMVIERHGAILQLTFAEVRP